MKKYYKDQLNNINLNNSQYPPQIKVFANGNGEDTKFLSLNEDSAAVLIEWLNNNFIKDKQRLTDEL